MTDPERIESLRRELARSPAHYAATGSPLFNQRFLLAKLDAANVIIDKLPKCWRLDELGKLVQDMPVMLGMKVWFFGPDVDGIESAIVRDISNRSLDGEKDAIVGAGDIVNPEWMMQASECYSTRKAAQAAVKEAEK